MSIVMDTEIVAGQSLWLLTSLAMAVLFYLLLTHKIYRILPAFCFYIGLNLLQAFALLLTHRLWNSSSPTAWRIGWISQIIVLVARAAAVIELCRLFLGRFPGIWALAVRVLSTSAVLAFTCGVSFGSHEWQFALPTIEMALELSLAVIILMLLMLARYYEVPVQSALQRLAAALCFYSCISVLNDASLEFRLAPYASPWNTVGFAAFLACLVYWTLAFRRSFAQSAGKPIYLDNSTYLQIVPEVNSRLRLLNERLAKFWKMEAPLP